MKLNWKSMLIVALLCLAVLIPAGTALSAIKIGSIEFPKPPNFSAANAPVTQSGPTPITVMTGGGTTGTWAIDLTQAADGTLTQLGPCVPGNTAGPCSNSETTHLSHDNYITPPDTGNGNVQEVYVNTFFDDSASPKYGLYKFKTWDGGHTLTPNGFDAVSVSNGTVALQNLANDINSLTGTPWASIIVDWLNEDNPALMQLAQQLDVIANSWGIPGTPIQDSVSSLTSYPLSAMLCSTDIASQTEDPKTGNLKVSDIATGLIYFYRMNPGGSGTWVATLAGGGTVCDLSFRESGADGIPGNGDDNDEAWSSGYSTNNIYHFTNASLAMTTGAMVLDASGSRINATQLSHQSRTFTLDGIEYVIIADGTAGDLLFIKTSDNNDANGPKSNTVVSGRFHIPNNGNSSGEVHSIGLNIPGGGNSGVTVDPNPDGNTATDDGYGINGVVPDFTDGSLTGVSIYHDSNGDLRVAVKNTVPGTGTQGDICGLDIVESGGQWVRN